MLFKVVSFFLFFCFGKNKTFDKKSCAGKTVKVHLVHSTILHHCTYKTKKELKYLFCCSSSVQWPQVDHSVYVLNIYGKLPERKFHKYTSSALFLIRIVVEGRIWSWYLDCMHADHSTEHIFKFKKVLEHHEGGIVSLYIYELSGC